MNRIAISMTMLIPPLFLLSLALAQPVSATPSNGGAPVQLPWGPAATAAPDGGFPGSEVVLGECTGSACSAGGGPTRVPDPLRAAPLVVNVAPDAARVNIAPGVLGAYVAPDALHLDVAPNAVHVNVAPNALGVSIAPDALHGNISSDGLRGNVTSEPLQVNVASDAPRGNIAPGVFRVDIGPDALRVGIAPDMPRVGSASDLRSVGGAQRPVSGEGATSPADDIARGGTGSASSLPRVFSDLLSRLLDLVQRAPLPLSR
ncbi:hypothetical protein [Nocardia sp. CA-120079]|uniref:hypothetical protein n=1 Tax=Nocardia sp. CA-120079 TaxID=3239974 RepID=UPI003D99D7E2